MRVVSGDDLLAVVEREGERRTVKMLLVGAVPAGATVLVHLGSAVRVLDEDEAAAMEEAIATVTGAGS
jgi:hydrogenase expression/formation protein HypC